MKSILTTLLLLITITAQAADLKAYTPSEALSDALSSPLHFVGKGMLYGYDSIESCLFRNDKVLVLHGYCISPEAPAADIQVYSLTRGQVVAIHAESVNDATAISLTNPKNYAPHFWYVLLGSLQASDLSIDTNFSDFANFYQNRYSKYPPNCLVSMEFDKCDASLAGYDKDWLPAAASFRKKPSASWKILLEKLRSLVQVE